LLKIKATSEAIDTGGESIGEDKTTSSISYLQYPVCGIMKAWLLTWMLI